MKPSNALKALERELDRTPARADGNFNAQDFMCALKDAIKSCEDDEYEGYMGEDM